MVKRNVRRNSRTLENSARLIEEGFRCYEQGNNPGAEKKLRAACAIRPSVPQAYFYASKKLPHTPVDPETETFDKIPV